MQLDMIGGSTVNNIHSWQHILKTGLIKKVDINILRRWLGQ